MKYNLQPYGKNGDTTGKRKIAWFEKQVINRLHQSTSTVIMSNQKGCDVGSGNGRLSVLLRGIVDDLDCIDPVCDFNPRFGHPRVSFMKKDFFDIKPKNQYGVLFFMGSLQIMLHNHGAKVWEHAANCACRNGTVIAMINKNTTENISMIDIHNCFETVNSWITPDNSSIVLFARRTQT